MKPKTLHDRIYETAVDCDLDENELNRLLCNADEIERIGTHDLHHLAYALAERGFLDEESLNNYLEAADEIAEGNSGPS